MYRETECMASPAHTYTDGCYLLLQGCLRRSLLLRLCVQHSQKVLRLFSECPPSMGSGITKPECSGWRSSPQKTNHSSLCDISVSSLDLTLLSTDVIYHLTPYALRQVRDCAAHTALNVSFQDCPGPGLPSSLALAPGAQSFPVKRHGARPIIQ